MARSEARIFTSIWRDPAFTCLPVDAQWLYEFLLGQDDLSYCGVLPLRPSRWCKKAADMTASRIEDALKWLEGKTYPTAYPSGDSAPTPLVVADAETGELFVRSLMRRDGIWKMPNIFKLAIEAAGQVESPRILGAMLGEAQRFPLEETGSEQVKTLVADFIGNLEKGGPYPTPYPPPDPSDYSSDDPTAKDYARARGSGGKVATYGNSPDPVPQIPLDLSMPAQARKRATRLPPGFTLTAEMTAWAAEHAPHVDASRELDRFRDYWQAKAGRDGAKLDWLATWRNWMRTAQDRQGPRDRPVIDRREQARSEQRARQMARAQEREKSG